MTIENRQSPAESPPTGKRGAGGDAGTILATLVLAGLQAMNDFREMLVHLGLPDRRSAALATVGVAWVVVAVMGRLGGARRTVVVVCAMFMALALAAAALVAQPSTSSPSAAPTTLPTATTSSATPSGPASPSSDPSPSETLEEPPAEQRAPEGSAATPTDEAEAPSPDNSGPDQADDVPQAATQRGDGCYTLARHGEVNAVDTRKVAVGHFVSGPGCDGLSIQLTAATTYTWAQACLQPVDGVDPVSCGPETFLDIGSWDELLADQPGNTGWQLRIWTAVPSHLEFEVTG